MGIKENGAQIDVSEKYKWNNYLWLGLIWLILSEINKKGVH